ncbi:DivIVA domain-containing protein [Micromonospora pisi]|uniref:Cell wall synthesis protein Wag31 n=1 Tax=Micromonospora pisi TaxID=589240 RepID=A0A495JIY3_9ACTN|nr:DivIVA domain-containing protein [Micromonospora pisi]RKR87959.1 DivIVA domain-containing protein [Micromonospora pisi]
MEDERDRVGRPRERTLLTPRDVRRKRFSPTGIGRRGYQPGEVREFLHLVEGDLAVLYQQLMSAREEATRMRTALREWQSRHNVCYVQSRQDAQESYRRPIESDQVRPVESTEDRRAHLPYPQPQPRRGD